MDQNPTFNLVDVAEVLKRRKGFIIVFSLLAVIVSAAIVFFVLSPSYKSTAVVVAANPLLADKGRLFNDNIEGLYSAFGGEDDLNRIYGIADLDTTYKALINKFNLVKYYQIEGDDVALNQRKAISELRDDVELIKNDLYLLQISATTKDRNLSASIANEIVSIIQNTAQDVLKRSYTEIANKLESSSTELAEQYKSLRTAPADDELAQIKKKRIFDQITKNYQVEAELRIASTANSPAVIVLDKAYPSAKPDKPKKLLTILASLVSALAFSIIMVLVFERRQ
jgi:capsular polysaccharide biosynthesis protein